MVAKMCKERFHGYTYMYRTIECPIYPARFISVITADRSRILGHHPVVEGAAAALISKLSQDEA